MNFSFELSIEVSEQYDFNKGSLSKIEQNPWVKNQWPLVYFIQNENPGLINHNYYQQDLYKDLFKVIWNKLIEKKIVSKSLEEIENSELFKYSPYKSLNEDQYSSVLEILEGLTVKKSNRIFISGSAGTGKTILASYLIKLLSTNIDESDYEDYNDDASEDHINMIRLLKKMKNMIY